MDDIRKEVINFMTNTPTLSKLRNEKWYETEDAIVNFICKMTGTTDKTYLNNDKKYDNQLQKGLDETSFTDKEYKIYQKVRWHFCYEDLDNYLLDNKDWIPLSKQNKIKNCADSIVCKYEDTIEYDWQTALELAIDFFTED